jgi:hypothetical protein
VTAVINTAEVAVGHSNKTEVKIAVEIVVEITPPRWPQGTVTPPLPG